LATLFVELCVIYSSVLVLKVSVSAGAGDCGELEEVRASGGSNPPSGALELTELSTSQVLGRLFASVES